MATKKRQQNFRLAEATISQLEKLSKTLGGKTAVITRLIQEACDGTKPTVKLRKRA